MACPTDNHLRNFPPCKSCGLGSCAHHLIHMIPYSLIFMFCKKCDYWCGNNVEALGYKNGRKV